jgi:guanylate kinase
MKNLNKNGYLLKKEKKSKLIIISGPSGVGKSTICKEIIKKYKNIFFSISVTTRSPRSGEIDGISYFFKTEKEFIELINKDELLEWAKYGENYYGTPKKVVEDLLKNGKNVLLEIETQGALNIKKKFPQGVFIFIVPTSLKDLQDRLIKRSTEDLQDIEKRILISKGEMKLKNEYKYLVISENDKIEGTLEKIGQIFKVENISE